MTTSISSAALPKQPHKSDVLFSTCPHPMGQIRLHSDGHHCTLCPHPLGWLGSGSPCPGPREPAPQHTLFLQRGARQVENNPVWRLSAFHQKPVAGGARLSPEQLIWEQALVAGRTQCLCDGEHMTTAIRVEWSSAAPRLASAPGMLRVCGMHWLIF